MKSVTKIVTTPIILGDGSRNFGQIECSEEENNSHTAQGLSCFNIFFSFVEDPELFWEWMGKFLFVHLSDK